MNFSIMEKGKLLPIGAPAAINGPLGCQDVMIYNPDLTSVLYVIAGRADVQADGDCMAILPGEKGAYRCFGATHITGFRESGTIPGRFWPGEGS